MSRVLKRHCVTPSLRTRIPSTFPCSKIAFAIARHYCQRGYAPACSRFSTSAPLSWKPTPILKSRVVFTGNSIEFDLDEADKTLYDNNLGFREEVVCIGPPLLPLPGYPEIKLGREFGADGDPPFRICRKLGWDGTSSVWLAFNGFKYLAFRALTQVASVPIQDGESQLYSFVKVLDDYYLNQLPDHPGFELVLKGELYFNIQPYDQQGQLVELTGPNIGLLKATSPDRRLPLDAVKVLCRQMLMALDFLHGTCGVVHTNIKPDTIFVKHILTTEEITKLLEEDPQRMYPGPAWTLIPVEDIKNRLMFPNPLDNSSVFRPTEEFVSQPLPAPLLTDIRTLTFKLGNFENVQLLQNKMRDKLHISPNMSPPELILGLPWDEKIDIWALGCTVFELLTGTSLFSRPPSLTSEESDARHLNDMVCVTGDSLAGFVPSIGPLAGEDSRSIGSRLAEAGFHNTERERATHFLRRCLTLASDKRPSALELFKDAWLVG